MSNRKSSEHSDMRQRCNWLTDDPLYIKYHDEEWGIPEYDSIKLFEMLCLEGQQAGLSWLTILKKRENYRKSFYYFDPYKIATMTNADIKTLLKNSSLVKHERKLQSIVNNAQCYLKMENCGEKFASFIWSFVNGKPKINNWESSKDIPTETPDSIEMSKALKKRNFKFVGPTVCYAFMQACGLVNDHIPECSFHKYEYKYDRHAEFVNLII